MPSSPSSPSSSPSAAPSAPSPAPVTGQTIAIFGATSEIGEHVALTLAPGNRLFLAGRRLDAVDALAQQCRDRGAVSVDTAFFDADDLASHSELIDQIERTAPIDIAYAMFGLLGDQQRAENDGGEVARILHTDFTAQAVLLTELTARMKQRRRGHVIAFSSIAGWRVRRPNYVYGSAKAGLDGFCQGMQDALQGTGVHLTIVRPGFVIGRMTEGMDPAPLSSTPDQVADAATAFLASPTPPAVVWVPSALRVLARAMSATPRWLWRRAPR